LAPKRVSSKVKAAWFEFSVLRRQNLGGNQRDRIGKLGSKRRPRHAFKDNRDHHSNSRRKKLVGGLVQGEGSILSHYVESNDFTTLVLMVSMTDPAPVFGFSDLVGLPRPLKPKPSSNPKYRPKWWRETTGLRALQVLREIQPFLVGEKLREAEKALILFSPTGYRRGCFRAVDVWPPGEFPFRNHDSRMSAAPQSGSRNPSIGDEA
jgi:hypothetical protein